MFAFPSNAVCVAMLTGLLTSLVLSTLPNQTCAFVVLCGLLVLLICADRLLAFVAIPDMSWSQVFVPLVLASLVLLILSKDTLAVFATTALLLATAVLKSVI